jgi:hypothetical protein
MRGMGAKFKSIALLGMLVLLWVTPVQAKIFTLWDKFPSYQGQNNFYAYGYQFSEDVLRQLTHHEDPNIYTYWTPEKPWKLPTVARLDNGWIYITPSSAYPPEDAVLAWAVTESSLFRLVGTFARSDSGGGGVTVYIRKNQDNLWSQTIFEGFGEASFDLANISLKKDSDVLYFGVNANGDDAYDSTKLRASLQTPEITGSLQLLLLQD